MEKLFSIPLCTTILTLTFLNIIKNPDNLIPPAILIITALFVIFFIIKFYTISILFISISISLLTGQKFLNHKEVFFQKKGMEICSKEYVKVRGKVLEFPLIGPETSSILVQVETHGEGKAGKFISFTIKIIVNGDLRNFYRGDTVEIDAMIKESRPPVNFFSPRTNLYLLANDIHFTGYSKSALLVEKVRKTNILMQLTGWARERIRSLIEKKYIRDNGYLMKEGQMLEALLLGDRGRLTPEVKEMLLDTGIFHLFAISGAHIGIIALFTLFLLNRTGLRMRKKYTILIITLMLFLMLTGFKISAQRAVLMAVLISISKMLYLKSDIINIISFTGLILLMKDPQYFLDPGFILTFTITAGIVSGRNIFFGSDQKKASFLKEMIAANINASITAIPLSLYFFMRYSFAGLLAGPVLLPVTAAIMCLSLPIIPLSLLPHTIAAPFMFLSLLPLKIFFFLAESFSGELDLTIFRAPPPFFILFSSLILFFLVCFSRKMRKVRILSTILACFTFSLMIIKPPPYDPEFPEIYFLEVGQGDSHIVVLPGGDSLLIDGGGSGFGDFEVGKQIVLPFILKQGIKIRWIAVSHYHPDHCRGVNEIVSILKPEEVWISSSPDENTLYRTLIDNCYGITRIRKISSGFGIKNRETKIELLFPFSVLQPFRTSNDHSQVIRVSYRNKKVLFTGDIENRAEKELIARYGRKLKCNILKVPHHGSNTSSSAILLKMTDPEHAVFPLGYRNSFGFPHENVTGRYKQRHINLLYTSEHGGIRMVLNPGEIAISVSRFGEKRCVNF